jgi:large subunit ribosomal protein L17
MMRNMAAQVIEHKEIKTTLAKAKELRGYVDRLITYGKKGTVHHRRLAFQFLQNKEAVTSLFDEVAPTFETRNGGYSRIIKLGFRKGDGAELSIFQLVGFEKSADKPKTKSNAKDKPKKEKAVDEVEEAEVVETKQPEPEIEEKPAKETEKTEQSKPEEESKEK